MDGLQPPTTDEENGNGHTVILSPMPSIMVKMDNDQMNNGHHRTNSIELELKSRHTGVTEMSMSSGTPSRSVYSCNSEPMIGMPSSLLSISESAANRSIMSAQSFHSTRDKPWDFEFCTEGGDGLSIGVSSADTSEGDYVRDPNGNLFHNPSGQVINKTSGRLMNEDSDEEEGMLDLMMSSTAITMRRPSMAQSDVCPSEATFKSTRSVALDSVTGQPKPMRKLSFPAHLTQSMRSGISEYTDGLMMARDARGRKIYTQPDEEFLLSVEFHWKEKYGFGLLCEHPSLPTVLRPYMAIGHWRVFTEAAMRLATRNYVTGTIYSCLGVLSVTVSVAYILYGVIPSDLGKYVAQHISIGAGIALLVAGICLSVWGWANRGGILMVQDMEAVCASASEQVTGMTIQYRPAEVLLERRKEEFESDKTLVFGIEIFCCEDATDEMTNNDSDHSPSDPLGLAGTDKPEVEGMDESNQTLTCMDESEPDHYFGGKDNGGGDPLSARRTDMVSVVEVEEDLEQPATPSDLEAAEHGPEQPTDWTV